ncbi:MAG: tRNA (adenosine(37)-N6)-dimethylallyltransferase MiaA [Deltaproteobacteria bacterium]|nr:tRNA (adenosine(37)-N6)-dimethylallyltransferase MiaA [Deltaproteobacteria bacterium]
MTTRTANAPKILVVAGETASGKTETAIRLAERFGGEIVNADSMQVYRGMDIGTATPTAEERSRATFHLISFVHPEDTYSAGRFKADADAAIAGILSRGHVPIVAGGTGLYLKALIHGLVDGPPVDRAFRDEMKAVEAAKPGALHERLRAIDPVKAEQLPPADLLRIIRALEVHQLTGRTLSEIQSEHRFGDADYRALKLGVRRDRNELEARVRTRVDEMVAAGLVPEVKALLDSGVAPATPAMAAVGYPETVAHLRGELDLDGMREAIVHNTMRLAKKQRTWYRGDKEFVWFTLPDEADALTAAAAQFLGDDESPTT